MSSAADATSSTTKTAPSAVTPSSSSTTAVSTSVKKVGVTSVPQKKPVAAAGKSPVAGGVVKKQPIVRERASVAECLAAINRPAIRRLSRRSGILRMGDIYDAVRHALYAFNDKILHDTCVATHYARRKTVTKSDILYALKRNGYHMVA